MADWWEPTRESYLAHVPKARLLEAVREGVLEEAAARLAGRMLDRAGVGLPSVTGGGGLDAEWESVKL
jgi:hypothetical protein